MKIFVVVVFVTLHTFVITHRYFLGHLGTSFFRSFRRQIPNKSALVRRLLFATNCLPVQLCFFFCKQKSIGSCSHSKMNVRQLAGNNARSTTNNVSKYGTDYRMGVKQ